MVRKPMISSKPEDSTNKEGQPFGTVGSLEASGQPKRLTRLTKGKESPNDTSPETTPMKSVHSESGQKEGNNSTFLQQVLISGSEKSKSENKPEGGRGGRRPRKAGTETPVATQEVKQKRKYVRKAKPADGTEKPAPAAAETKARVNQAVKSIKRNGKSRESRDKDNLSSSVSGEETSTAPLGTNSFAVVAEKAVANAKLELTNSQIANETDFVNNKQFEILTEQVKQLANSLKKMENTGGNSESEQLKSQQKLFASLALGVSSSLTAAKIQIVIDWCLKNCEEWVSSQIVAELKGKSQAKRSERLGTAKKSARATNNKGQKGLEVKSPSGTETEEVATGTATKSVQSKIEEESAKSTSVTASEQVEAKSVVKADVKEGVKASEMLLGKRKGRGGRRGGNRGGRGRSAKLGESESKTGDEVTPSKRGRGGRGSHRGGRRMARLGPEVLPDANSLNTGENNKSEDEAEESKKNDTLSGRQTGAGDSEARESSSQEVKPLIGAVGLSMSPNRFQEDTQKLEADHVQAVC